MPTHYLIVYENRSALGQQSISKQIVSKTYFTRQFGMTILLNIVWTSHVPKMLDVYNLSKLCQ